MTTQPIQPENNDIQATVEEESFASRSPATTNVADSATSNQEQDTSIVASPPTFTGDEAVPPFTSFIEEFRQREERWNALAGQADTTDRPLAAQNNSATTEQDAPVIATQDNGTTSQDAPVAADAINRVSPTTPERPVSPLLRPASRGRIPRQGGRQRETFVNQASAASAKSEHATRRTSAANQVSAETSVAPVEPVADTTQRVPTVEMVKDEQVTDATHQASPVIDTHVTEQGEAPRPARRYRFDRPAVSPKPVTDAANRVAPPPARNDEIKDARLPQVDTINRVPTVDNTLPDSSRAITVTPVEAQPPVVAKVNAPAKEKEAVSQPAGEATATPARANNDRRRRHGQEGQRVKEPAVSAAPVPGVTPVPEVQVPGAQTETTTASDLPVEDLPPLEYADLQAANSRRRRRRRTNGTNGNGVTVSPIARPAALPITPAPMAVAPVSPTAPSTIAPVSSVAPFTPARNVALPSAPVTPQPATPYTIQSGITVNQMNQGNDATGPFQGPEPTPARGSVLPTQPRLVRPLRNGSDVQRGPMPITPAQRGNEGMLSTGAVNHLANVISQSIQLQSDRMVAELRRANQTPTNISVSLPPFPSMERVGVFVDVANLLYSARTLRMTIDFGKLLDFLRGNRRLVRAHAYCPTSPQPGDDQMFLQAVKGLGYRITTKNYKTFASGAKKADMDLDLCMDVVRLVDGGSVDCIVLVSGDGDFIPMLDYCSDHGVRVEVVAFDESMSATLRQSCDLFINLSMLDEIRA